MRQKHLAFVSVALNAIGFFFIFLRKKKPNITGHSALQENTTETDGNKMDFLVGWKKKLF